MIVPYSFLKQKRQYPSLFNQLVAVYGFDDGNNLAKDTIGRHELTAVNAAASYTQGKLLGCLASSTVSGGWMRATNSEFLIRPNFTTCLWIKFTFFGAYNTVFFGQTSQATLSYIDVGGQPRLNWNLWNQNTSTSIGSVTSSQNLAVDTWYFVCLSFDGSVYKMEINNSIVDTLTSSDYFTGTFVQFNFGGTTQTIYFDEVSVWHRILTSDEKAAIYNNGNGRRYPYF